MIKVVNLENTSALPCSGYNHPALLSAMDSPQARSILANRSNKTLVKITTILPSVHSWSRSRYTSVPLEIKMHKSQSHHPLVTCFTVSLFETCFILWKSLFFDKPVLLFPYCPIRPALGCYPGTEWPNLLQKVFASYTLHCTIRLHHISYQPFLLTSIHIFTLWYENNKNHRKNAGSTLRQKEKNEKKGGEQQQQQEHNHWNNNCIGII